MTNNTTPLTAEEKATRAAYFREWRAKNREKVKLYNQRYWQKRAAQAKEGGNIAAEEN